MSLPNIIRQAAVGGRVRTPGGIRPAPAAAPSAVVAMPVTVPEPPLSEPETPTQEIRPGLTEADVERRAAELARVLVEQEAQAAREAAHKKGYAEGMAAAEKLGRQEIERLRAHAADLSSSLRSAVEREWDASETLAVEVAVAAVGRLLGEAAWQAEVLTGLVRQAAEGLRGEGRLRVRLAPTDAHFLREHGVDLAAHVPSGLQVDVLDDAALDAGGCVLETDYGSVDARLDHQLAEICRVLREIHHMRASDRVRVSVDEGAGAA